MLDDVFSHSFQPVIPGNQMKLSCKLPLQLFLLLFLVPPLEDLQLSVGVLDLLSELPNFHLKLFLALLDLCSQLFAFLLDVGVLPDQVFFELLVHKGLGADG